MSLLSSIHGPDDLKRLRRDQLPQLAADIRERLIECCSQTGGHIGASLGVVELTIALLYEFDSPTDKVLWDVGHQAYAWKLLTGRNERLPDAAPDRRHLRLPQAQRERARPVRRRARRHGDVGRARHGHGARPEGASSTRSSRWWATAPSPAASPTRG